MNVTTILIIVNVFTALAMIALVLMQTSKGDMGSAFGGGGSQGMFGARGSSNFLSKTTSLMCTVFFLTSLALAYVYAQRANTSSVVETSVIDQVSEVPSIETEIDNSVPSLESDTPSTEEQGTVPTLGQDAVEALEQAAEDVSEEVPVVEEAQVEEDKQ